MQATFEFRKFEVLETKGFYFGVSTVLNYRELDI